MEKDIFNGSGSGYEQLGAGMRKALAELRVARTRRERGEFVVEGTKAVLELLPLFHCRVIAATFAWLERHHSLPTDAKVLQTRRADLERISSMSNPPDVVAVFEMPKHELDIDALGNELVVALDDVQDPGNLGTVIRACDWFGVTTLLCSEHTADAFSSKVIQSTMGAIGRVKVHYVDLPAVLGQLGVERNYGTFLDGDNIYDAALDSKGVIVMGNEGHGISSEVADTIGRRLYIPPFPVDVSHVESLNVAMATAITLAEFRRRK